MSRTYEYVFNDPAGSHLTITTGDRIGYVERIDGSGVTYGYAIQSITGMFNGEAVVGMYGNGGELQFGIGTGYFSNEIYDIPGQGEGDVVDDIASVGIVFSTATTIYTVAAFDGALHYEYNRQSGTITVASFEHPVTGDTTPPHFEGGFPSDGGVNVGVDDTLALFFDEPMKLGNGTITLSDGAGDTRVIDVHDASQIYLISGTLTLDPAVDLLPGRTYHISFSEGSFTDLWGNALAALPDALSFTTQSILTGADYVLSGGENNDVITGTATDHLQSLIGNGGSDIITLAAAGGFAYGGAGDDYVYGGNSLGLGHFTGNTLFDDQGYNHLFGGNANDGGTVQNLIHAGSASGAVHGGDATGRDSFAYNLIDGDGSPALLVSGGNADGGAAVQNFVRLTGQTSRVEGGQAHGAGSQTDNDLAAALVFGGSASGGGHVVNRLQGSELHAGVALDAQSSVDNILTGTAGADRFIFTSGGAHTVITDFVAGTESGHDQLDLRNFGINTFSSFLYYVEDVAGSAVIHSTNPFLPHQDIVLQNVLTSALTAEDFVLLG